MRRTRLFLIGSFVVLGLVGACGDDKNGTRPPPSNGDGGPDVTPPMTSPDGAPDVTPPMTSPDGAPDVITVPVGPAPNATAYASAKAALIADTPASADAFLTRWRPAYQPLPYDPSSAVNLSLIQQSSLQLNAAELGILSKSGLAISARQSFGTFFMGYTNIYANDLPLFVSGDSVLHAVHRSYDAILKSIEYSTLAPGLKQVLDGMRSTLATEAAAGTWPAETVLDIDEYLAVAATLIVYNGPTAAPVAGGSSATIASLVAQAKAGAGAAEVTLFGQQRQVDFSQFTPRGHYAGDSILAPYFQAMMWLGRTDLRLVTQKKTGEVAFNRRQFAAAALLARLVEPVQSTWAQIDRTLRSFVGESDNMMPTDFATLRTAAGAASWAALLAQTDDQLASAIVAGGFGIQRIASQLLFVELGNEGAPLDRAFLLLGQRFVIDSQVLANVVYDRVEQQPYRLMPSPLDVAFAALGNSGAADLLTADLKAHPGYPQALHQARALVDQHEAGYWSESLYTSWLGAIRAGSPGWGSAARPNAPAITATQAWTLRTLQMQLASWTELRHDNLLYAKQSYTGIPVCEFPDAYVEPNPPLWHALADFGNRGAAILADLGLATSTTSGPAAYFTSLAGTATMLEAMALQQEQGVAFTADQMAFINQAVEYKTESVVCTTIKRPSGWYPKLFYDPDSADDQDTIVADVHTQPADDAGNIVGKVLHVGTGFPRLMVVTFQTCSGPRAYAGVVSAYHETVTDNFNRLTDQQWTTQLAATPPAEVSWMADLVSR
jgi:hypothetical protein